MLLALNRLLRVPTTPAAVPIVDGRSSLSWRHRLPLRLGTAGLWLGATVALGPIKIAGVLLIGGVVVPSLLLLDRSQRRFPTGSSAACSIPSSPPLTVLRSAGVPRASLAAQAGLPEATLFRARHAVSCTVQHDADGRIVALIVPRQPVAIPLTRSDAHPVG